MKKQLLNQKSVAQLFFIHCLTLLGVHSISSQTLLNETFGTTAVAAASNYGGGTSTPSPSVNYTTNVPGYTAVASDANNTGFLNFVSTGTIRRISVAGPLPTGSGLNGVLHSNTKLITWTFNMRAGRLSTNTFSSSTGYPENKYFSAVVLCATNESLLSNSPTPGTGYMVSVQKSTNNSLSGKGSINLIKYSNGIGDAATTGAELSVVTRLIESPELNQIPNLSGFPNTPNNLSIKVTYNPTNDVWELFYREDPVVPTPVAFVDPTSGTLTLGGSATDVPTSTAMTHFGYVAGLQTSFSAANTYQFDNFNIGLSTPPPYTSPPTVEKRQAFNSAANPTVLNLVAAGSNGAIFNWYTTATGGSPLITSTPLTYSTYYVSQTVNGTESSRVATQVFVGDTALKTLPLYEGFANYTIADKLLLMNNGASTAVATNQATGLGSWSMAPSANITDDVTIVASPVWTNLIAPAIASGNAMNLVGSGVDPELKFTNTTNGSLYSSFVFTATDVTTIVNATTAAAAATPSTTVPNGVDPDKSTPTGIYSFLSESTDPLTNIVSTSYSANVMFRKVFGTTNKFNIGLSKSNSGSDCVWSPTEFDFGTQHLIVISYENIGDPVDTNQVANLWIDPVTSTQPAVTLTQNNPISAIDGITPVKITRSNIDRIKILQASSTSTPLLVIDEIRVANNFGEAVGGASTLSIAKMNVSKFSVYPNPVTNGKLFISSASSSEKQVAIYSLLGQKVLQTITANNTEINVSKLAKGTYILNVTEDGKSESKKVMIK